MTTHVQALEEQLQTPLFDRLGRTVALTEIGTELYVAAKKLLSVYEEIEKISLDRDKIQGTIRIAAPESVTIYRVEPILTEYRQRYPEVRITLMNSTCSEMRHMLIRGEVDIAFLLMASYQHPDLIIRDLVEEEMLVLASAESCLERLDEHNEIQESVIYNEGDCSYRIAFENYLKDKDIVTVNAMELSSIESIKRCIISGLGISMLPLAAVKKELEEEALKVIRIDQEIEEITTKLAYNKNKWLSPAVEKFIEVTLKHASEWQRDSKGD